MRLLPPASRVTAIALFLYALASAAATGREADGPTGAAAAGAVKTSRQPLRILAVMTIDTMSHHLWMAPLTAKLAARGHLVTSVDVAMPKDVPATLNVSVIETAFATVSPEKITRWLGTNTNLLLNMPMFSEFAIRECEMDFVAPTMRRILDKSNKEDYDLIIVDYAGECMLGLAHRFGYPGLVVLSPFPGSPWIDSLMGVPLQAAAVPFTLQPFPQPMALWQRAATFGLNVYVQLLEWWYLPEHDRLLRAHFGEGVPSARDLRRSVAVALVNENPVLEPARALPPNVIPVGGMHISPANVTNIPVDLLAWLDEASDGFVFVSFGSIMKGAYMDAAKKRALTEAFGALGKVRVLWKMEADALEDSLPSNVRIASWLPQSDLLGHPKLLLFVSHCGGLSTQEASFNGVPVLGVPVMVDQFINLEKLERLGMARRMPYADITADRLLAELMEMVTGRGYREAARRVSLLLRDQKETPLERAVWWAEYVGRHRGAPHLHSPALDLAWHQAALLDVVPILVVAALVVPTALAIALSLRSVDRQRVRVPSAERAKKD